MKNNNLIAISGKINSGKNSVATIIQGLNASLDRDVIIHHVQTNKPFSESSGYKQVAFADKLKEVVSILLNCSREQLNDRNFKNSFLSEFNMTVREFLQKTGDGLSEYNPDIFVNSLFADYKGTGDVAFILKKRSGGHTLFAELPKWIITDTRFENELEAVEQRNGITIRVNRGIIERTGKVIQTSEHESEISLDNAKFDYTIENNSDIEDLIRAVKQILIIEKVI